MSHGENKLRGLQTYHVMLRNATILFEFVLVAGISLFVKCLYCLMNVRLVFSLGFDLL